MEIDEISIPDEMPVSFGIFNSSRDSDDPKVAQEDFYDKYIQPLTSHEEDYEILRADVIAGVLEALKIYHDFILWKLTN